MEVRYLGGNCVKLQTKKVSVVVDDNLESLGLSSATKSNDISLVTNTELIKKAPDGEFKIDRPGEYEIMDVSIQGIAARAHIDEATKKNAVIYRLVIEDFKIGILGHIHPDLSDEQLEALGMVDLLIIPVGGNGYTIDAVGALKLIKKISPYIVIPTHYEDKKLKYEVPQTDLETIKKTLSMEPSEEIEELKLKSRDFGEGTKLLVLKRS